MAEVKAWQLQRPRKHANGRVARTTGVMAETAGDAGAWTTRLAPHSPRPRLFLFARGPGPGFALVTPLQEPPHRRAPQHAADGEDHHRQRKQDAQVRDVPHYDAQNTVGQFGTFTVQPDGSYTFTLDNSLPAVAQLGAGEQLTETFTATARDVT